MGSNRPLQAYFTAVKITERVNIELDRAMANAGYAFPDLDPEELEREVAFAAWRWAARHGMALESGQDAPGDVSESEVHNADPEQSDAPETSTFDLAPGSGLTHPPGERRGGNGV